MSGVESLSANGAQSTAISISTHQTFVSDTGISTIDLSADTDATGNNVINISAQTTSTAMSLTGSAGKDTITLDAGSVDTVNVAITNATTTIGNTADIIAAFDDANDLIDFGDMAAGTGANYAEAASDLGANDTIGVAAALIIANTAMNGTIIYHFQDNTNGGADNGYLFFDHDADGTADGVVILSGLTAVGDFSEANIIA